MPNEQPDSELSFFSALRGLRHLFFHLENDGIKLHSACYDCREVQNFIEQPRCRGGEVAWDNWEQGFTNALARLKHLYFLLGEVRLDFHSECDGCYEIRNFMNTPGYRGNREDRVGVFYYRPLT